MPLLLGLFAIVAAAVLSPELQGYGTAAATPARQCMLVIPPAQVERVPRLELVYSSPPLGWIIVAGPLDCD